MTKTIHLAKGYEFQDGGPKRSRKAQWWASVDGDHWLPVNRKPTASDYDAVADLFESHLEKNAKGEEVHFTRMRYARRYITAHWGAQAVMVDPIIID